jgi:hypothetical protein
MAANDKHEERYMKLRIEVQAYLEERGDEAIFQDTESQGFLQPTSVSISVAVATVNPTPNVVGDRTDTFEERQMVQQVS